MKKIHLLFFVITIFFLFQNVVYPQIAITTEEESVIEMSPAELQILLEELLQAKKRRLAYLAANQTESVGNNSAIQTVLEEQNLRQQMDGMERTLNSLHEKIGKTPTLTKQGLDQQDLTILKQQLLGKIQGLKTAFDAFSVKATAPISTPQKGTNSDKELIVFATQMMQLRTSLDSLFSKMNTLVQKEEFEILGQQLDVLEKKMQAPVYAGIDSSTVSQWNKQFTELRMLLEKAQLKQPVTVEETPKSTSPSSYDLLKSIIAGKERQQIFFKNNSFVLAEIDQNKLQQSIELVGTHEHLDVLLIGYADEKGSPYYNQELSQKRAESVKKYLMTQAIHPNRIFIQSQGVDYNAADKATARRVDLVLLIKR